MATYFALPEEPRPTFWHRCLSFGSVAALQGLGLLLAVSLAIRPDLVQPLQALTVRMLEIAPAPPQVEPPQPKPVLLRKALPAPPPIMTASRTASTVPTFVVAAQPEPRPLESLPALPVSPAPQPLVAARFDADYLHNPKPVYPSLSRRMGEEGKVVLRVHVSAQGISLQVDIKQSSGYPRLDEAGRAAVEKWHFVPARQGSDTVEATVLVPLHFTLDS
jgi:periplasmic protein TonB